MNIFSIKFIQNKHRNIYSLCILLSPIAAAVNKRLRGLAKENGCKFINITSAINFDNRELRVFEALRFYFRVKPICFSDAMKFAPVN